MVYLDRYKSGEIRETRTCSPEDHGTTRMICEDSTPDHNVNCCHFNMCNADITLTFPTTITTLASNKGKGNWDF